MKLKKLKFKEVGMPIVTLIFFSFGLMFVLLGMVANFKVVQENGGKMPVWIDGEVYNTKTHFQITNISEVNQLQFADMWYWKGVIWSIGDLSMFFGFFLVVISLSFMVYNDIIKIIISFKNKNGK